MYVLIRQILDNSTIFYLITQKLQETKRSLKIFIFFNTKKKWFYQLFSLWVSSMHIILGFNFKIYCWNSFICKHQISFRYYLSLLSNKYCIWQRIDLPIITIFSFFSTNNWILMESSEFNFNPQFRLYAFWILRISFFSTKWKK